MGTPIYIQLAIIKMESDFNWLAKPKRQKIFKVIPIKDPQAHLDIRKLIKEHGNNIKKKRNKLARRTSFKDSVDFIGWYTNKTEKILKISKSDAFKQYIAYHEGWGNYKNIKKIQKLLDLLKELKNNQINIKINYKSAKKIE